MFSLRRLLYRGTPRYAFIRRWIFMAFLLSAGLLCLLTAMMVTRGQWTPLAQVMFWISCASVMPGLPLSMWVYLRWEARLIDRAAAHDYLLCPCCIYPLRPELNRGQCPECGQPFEREGVKRAWRTFEDNGLLPRCEDDEKDRE